MDLNQLKTDPEKVEKGTWVRVDEDTRLRISRFGSHRFQQAFKERMGPNRKIKGKKLTDKENEEITVDIILDGILFDWEGVKLNGEDVPFSHAREILLNPKYRDFRVLIGDLADDIENFREDEVEEDREN